MPEIELALPKAPVGIDGPDQVVVNGEDGGAHEENNETPHNGQVPEPGVEVIAEDGGVAGHQLRRVQNPPSEPIEAVGGAAATILAHVAGDPPTEKQDGQQR